MKTLRKGNQVTVLCGQLPGCSYTYGTQGHSWGGLGARTQAPQAGPRQLRRERGTRSFSQTWKTRGVHIAFKDSFCFLHRIFGFFFFLGGTLILVLGAWGILTFGGNVAAVRTRLRQVARGAGSCTYLFVGPFVSVHLHHPLTEHVERVFLMLRPVGTQPLPFRGHSPVEQSAELATPAPTPGLQDTGNSLGSQSGQSSGTCDRDGKAEGLWRCNLYCEQGHRLCGCSGARLQ